MAPVTRSKTRLNNGAVHFESLKVLERKRIRRKLEGLTSAHLDAPDDDLSAKAEDMQCSICSFVFYIPFSLLPCKHTYCKRCISEWMNRQLTCPLCRCEPTAFKKCSDLSKEIQILSEGLSATMKEELGFRSGNNIDEVDDRKSNIIMLEDGLTIDEFKRRISQRITATLSELETHASSAAGLNEGNRATGNTTQGQHRNLSQYRSFPNHRNPDSSFPNRSRYRHYRGPFHSRNRHRQLGEPFVRYDFGASANANQNIAFRAAQQVQDLLFRSASFPFATILPQAHVDIQRMLGYNSSRENRWAGNFETPGALPMAPGILQFGQFNPVQATANDLRLNGVSSVASQPREVTSLSSYSLSLQVLANAGLHNSAAASILPQNTSMTANLLPSAHVNPRVATHAPSIPLNLGNSFDQRATAAQPATNILAPHLSFLPANPFQVMNEMRNNASNSSNPFCSNSSPFSFVSNDALAAAATVVAATDLRRSGVNPPRQQQQQQWAPANTMPTTRGYNQYLRPSFSSNVSLSFHQPNNSVLFSVVDLSSTTNIIDASQSLTHFNQLHF